LLGGRLTQRDAQGDCQIVGKRAMLFKNPYFTSTVLFSRAAYLEVGGFDRHQRYSEDYKLWLAFAWQGKACGVMNHPLAHYSPHATGPHRGLSSQRWAMQRHELGNFRWLHQTRQLPLAWSLSAQLFSWLKFLRRLLAAR
jgi:hypothetical protein